MARSRCVSPVLLRTPAFADSTMPQDDEPQTPPATAPPPSTTATATLEADPNARQPEVAPTDEADLEVAENSALGKEIARQLKETYMPLELWYLRTAIERVSRLLWTELDGS